MSPRHWFLLPLAVACGPTSLGGEWDGTCTIDLDGRDSEVQFEFRMDPEVAGKADGVGDLEHLDDVYAGYVWATRLGREVEFELEAERSGWVIPLEVQGTLVDDQVEGRCLFDGERGRLDMEK